MDVVAEVAEVAEVSSAPEVSQTKLVKKKMRTKRAPKSQQTKVALLLRPSRADSSTRPPQLFSPAVEKHSC